MATTTKQMPAPQNKTPAAPKTEKKPLSEKEQRERFATNSTGVLRTLERAAKRTEKIMRQGGASDNQIAVFLKGVNTLSDRVLRAARGETTASGFSVPSE